jgi:carboxymethylenebutenolidase
MRPPRPRMTGPEACPSSGIGGAANGSSWSAPRHSADAAPALAIQIAARAQVHLFGMTRIEAQHARCRRSTPTKKAIVICSQHCERTTNTVCDAEHMTETITLTSAHDGFSLAALSARPSEAPIGGVVVIQEIFGLTEHIGECCAIFADAGYATLAPGLFERVERNFHAGHDDAGIMKGRNAVLASPWRQVVADVQAAIDALPKPCYVTGFCYGGAVAWMAAAQCTGLKAASCFYGRLIADLLDNTPTVPVMFHYGARDPSIPVENVERVRLAAPTSPLYLYDAGHGFCRAGSQDFDSASRDLAISRTIDWFARWR